MPDLANLDQGISSEEEYDTQGVHHTSESVDDEELMSCVPSESISSGQVRETIRTISRRCGFEADVSDSVIEEVVIETRK